MKISNKFIGFVCVVAIVYVAGSPFVAVYQIRFAAEARDGEALSEHIEFPSLRQSFKDQFNAFMMSKIVDEADYNPFGALVGVFAGVMVDKMVDAYVTPSGIAKLMKGQTTKPVQDTAQSAFGSQVEPFKNASMRYASWGKFVVSVPNKSGHDIRFILRRRGIGWKITEIRLPINEM